MSKGGFAAACEVLEPAVLLAGSERGVASGSAGLLAVESLTLLAHPHGPEQRSLEAAAGEGGRVGGAALPSPPDRSCRPGHARSCHDATQRTAIIFGLEILICNGKYMPRRARRSAFVLLPKCVYLGWVKKFQASQKNSD